jgi:hypothetical protein
VIPIAHAAHFIELPIYLGPVLLLIAWVKLDKWRDRRRKRR